MVNVQALAPPTALGVAAEGSSGTTSQSMAGQPGVSQMKVVADWIRAWQLSTVAVTNLGFCIDTHDEALARRMDELVASGKL